MPLPHAGSEPIDGSVPTAAPTILSHKIPERWFPLVRFLWTLVASLALLSLIAYVLPRLAELQTICIDVVCRPQQASPLLAKKLEDVGLSIPFYATTTVLIDLLFALAFILVASVMVWRRVYDGMAVFVAFILVMWGVVVATEANEALLAATHPAVRLLDSLFRFCTFAGIPLLFYLFPDGRFVPKWMRWLATGWVMWRVLLFVFPNSLFQMLMPIVWPIFIVTWIGAQVYRYRHISSAVHRQQTKWVVYGVTMALGGSLLVRTLIVPWLVQPHSLVGWLMTTSILLFLMLIPVSIGIAILRYRLYEIDIIIRRTLVYSALTLTLGLVYVGCIVLSRTLVAPLTGGSELAIVISTLLIAALFTPLRRHIQNIIDKRFYRRKYDAAKVLTAFGAKMRDETNLDALTAEMLRVVDETMQPEFVGLWLRDPQARNTTEAARSDSSLPR